MNDFFTRIMQVADYKGFKNVSDFAKNGLFWDSSEKLNRLKKENNKPSVDILLEISNRFDEISLEWLITGKGEMLKNEGQITQNGTNNIVQSGKKNNAKIVATEENIVFLREKIALLEEKEALYKDKITYLTQEIERLKSSN